MLNSFDKILMQTTNSNANPNANRTKHKPRLSTMPSSTRSMLLLAATVALLMVGTTMAARPSKTGLRDTNLQRLLVEGAPGPTCAAGGSTADGSYCNGGADCSSRSCEALSPGQTACHATCVPDGNAVILGDGCSCCSGQGDGSDPGFGIEFCLASSP